MDNYEQWADGNFLVFEILLSVPFILTFFCCDDFEEALNAVPQGTGQFHLAMNMHTKKGRYDLQLDDLALPAGPQ